MYAAPPPHTRPLAGRLILSLALLTPLGLVGMCCVAGWIGRGLYGPAVDLFSSSGS